MIIANQLIIGGIGSLGGFSPLNLGPMFAFTGATDGSGNLIDVSGNGYNATYISGSGLDAIYDFSTLNTALGSNQLNKNAYLGNGFGLPENYDFPYPAEIYHDPANPTYWKLTDFHYKNLNKQSLLVDNIAFLKAKATTSTSNIISEVNELYIYSSAQSGGILSGLLAYINIADTFYGDYLGLNYEFSDGSDDWVVGANWVFDGDTACQTGGLNSNISQDDFYVVGTIEISTRFYNNNLLRIFYNNTGSNYDLPLSASFTTDTTEIEQTSAAGAIVIRANDACLDYIRARQKFEHYYKT